MIRLENVLVASDFGDASDAALAYGRELARSFGAKLHLLHVADNILTRYAVDSSVLISPEVQADFEGAQRHHLDRLLTSDDRRGLRAVAVLRTSNDTAGSIVDYAKTANVDVIVMGTHGRRAFARMMLGSVAERVVRIAPCPVLTVRHPEHEFLTPDALASAAKA
jgi:nucleotide-binding universal stress UspA family protein